MCVQVLYLKGVERGWLKSWYYGDALLYALSTATLFHAVSALAFADNTLSMLPW